LPRASERRGQPRKGRLAIAVFVAGAEKPAYFILLEFVDGRVTYIRDFRCVPYIARDAEFDLVIA
jgi:hypothetical protein